MPRTRRLSPGGYAYHVMNRCVAGLELFEDEGDDAAFLRVLEEARQRFAAMRLCAYCLMPNHFHLVLWPGEDGLLSRFMQWLTMTHTQRWHAHRHSAGRGHVYQSRFKSFPIEQDRHFLTVCRYVERNPLRAGLVRKAENWRWGSLAAWMETKSRVPEQTPAAGGPPDVVMCDAWPASCPRPSNWVALVNRPQRQAEVEAVRRCAQRGSPLGDEAWVAATADRLDLESSLRRRGRPRREA